MATTEWHNACPSLLSSRPSSPSCRREHQSTSSSPTGGHPEWSPKAARKKAVVSSFAPRSVAPIRMGECTSSNAVPSQTRESGLQLMAAALTALNPSLQDTRAHTHTYNNQGQTSIGTHASALLTSLTSITFTTQYTLSMGKEEAEIQLQDGHGMVPPWYTILCLTFYFVTGLFHSSEVAAVTRLIGNWFTSQATAIQSQPSGHRLRLRMSGIGYSTRYLFARSFCRLHTSDSM